MSVALSVDPSAHAWMSNTVCLLLDADPSPGLLPRLLQPFAKRDIVPDGLWSCRSGETMRVEISIDDVPPEVVNLIVGNLHQIVGVRRVTRSRTSAMRQTA